MRTAGNPRAVEVSILGSEGCSNTPLTLELVKNVAQDLDILVNIETITVATREQAQELRFFGSPTVRVDGLDIEQSVRDSEAFGLA